MIASIIPYYLLFSLFFPSPVPFHPNFHSILSARPHHACLGGGAGSHLRLWHCPAPPSPPSRCAGLTSPTRPKGKSAMGSPAKLPFQLPLPLCAPFSVCFLKLHLQNGSMSECLIAKVIELPVECTKCSQNTVCISICLYMNACVYSCILRKNDHRVCLGLFRVCLGLFGPIFFLTFASCFSDKHM